ncbi:hypothetical protein SELMODRAFT_236333 [Selaginella moellendorffii]|uniref:Protein-lysine N-methyltransferase SELMODRAFT_236333 n=1 Tax=Selaginella moellendorffii TaxID=88036 RepID=D8T7P4_SELML|nr:EEF1A lysine methyltransferase 1 [Selaginella moellendorffii]XP_024521089.1 EEF1A lysine methyltransferase 1 [Selaginella moellendorffii]EFJ07374.1 hypothetical protein SELMODRAFT_236333 [Selaginella moellendorffii]|eukprot:XP_002991620.1 EEF1A lysine methyltransferase 1 [Selaginella moellendorffii]
MAGVEDDSPPALSAHALEALRDFMRERDCGGAGDGGEGSVGEDWGLSQFWYDDFTARIVAEEVVRVIGDAPERSVACIACPSLYTMLKKIYPGIRAHLFEYDRRFARHGSDFTYYDYNHPEDLPRHFEHRFYVVAADPPYLSEECLEKTTRAVQFLSEDHQKSPVLLLTGSVQQERAFFLLGVQPCGFRPAHKHKLGNEFKLYTNYDPGDNVRGWELKE